MDIGRFTFLGGPGAFPLDIVLGAGSLNQLDSPTTAIGRDWEGFDASGLTGDSQFAGRVGGDLVGSIIVGDMFRFDADGEIQAPIYADYSGNGGGMVVEADTITSAGYIEVTSGNLKRVRSNSGGIFASIEATNSSISDGVYSATDIGTSTTPITIIAGGNINKVQATNIYANISAVDGNIGLIDADSGEMAGTASTKNIQNASGTDGILVDGDLVLSLTLAGGTNPSIRDDVVITGGDFSAASSIYAWGIGDAGEFKVLRSGGVGGYLRGDITFTGNLSNSSPFTIDESLEGTINIGQSLKDTITINGLSTGGHGLTGQIIVNSNNDSSVWEEDATITVGSTTLTWNSHGEYTETAASLGGGAVGLVPFSTHRESCAPVHGADQGTPASITLQFYGPVIQDTVGSDMPVRVWRGEYGTGANEADVTSSYTVEMHPGGDRRRVKIKPGTAQFRPQYRYRLVPITSNPGSGETILLCDDLLTASDVPVKGRDYYIDVKVVMSMLDLGANGWVDSPDVALWMNAPQDFNGDDSADTHDLQLIVDNLGEPAD